LDEGGTDYFLLIHQARTSDGVPEKVVELMNQYSMDNYVKQLQALFREGQELGELVLGDVDEMISAYLSVLSGLMILNVQKLGGYQLPRVDMLLRMIAL
jgi:hypothetical protein